MINRAILKALLAFARLSAKDAADTIRALYDENPYAVRKLARTIEQVGEEDINESHS